MSVAESRPSSRRRYVTIALKATVSVVLLAVLLSRVDTAGLWEGARSASPVWLLIALALYACNLATGTWRWLVLLRAQDVWLRKRTLLGSYLVATFFSNFLPSNIGGDVVRIRDTAQPAGSKTLATTIVLVDRVLGLMGLMLVAAVGATISATRQSGTQLIWPMWLWAGFTIGAVCLVPIVLAPSGFKWLLQPIAIIHPEWVGKRLETLTEALSRFRDRPAALAGCFTGAVVVQTVLVIYYLAVVHALHMPVTFWDLAVIVPISLVIQMLPVSVNGFGVREAAFAFYFARLGLPIQSALLLSLVSTALAMLFSLSGAAVYVSRGRAGSLAGS
jgi:glycosyltransferase 2 family protein